MTGVETATLAAGTLKVVVREPWGTVTGDDIVTAEAGLAVTVTAAPPAGAAPVNVTVQEVLAGAANETGEHAKPFSPGWIVTVPLVVDVINPAPFASAAELPANCS